MIIIKTNEEVELMEISAKLVSKTLAELAKVLKAGTTTLQIDQLPAEFIGAPQAVASVSSYGRFPYNICASVIDVVLHGFPNSIPLKDGDIVSLDVGLYKNGSHGDPAFTCVIGEAPTEHLQLVKTTKESLYKG